MPNVTSETHSSSSSSSRRSRRRRRSSSSRSSSSSSRSSSSRRSSNAMSEVVMLCNTMEKITCRQGNTMPLKDGEAPKLHPENA